MKSGVYNCKILVFFLFSFLKIFPCIFIIQVDFKMSSKHFPTTQIFSIHSLFMLCFCQDFTFKILLHMYKNLRLQEDFLAASKSTASQNSRQDRVQVIVPLLTLLLSPIFCILPIDEHDGPKQAMSHSSEHHEQSRNS